MRLRGLAIVFLGLLPFAARAQPSQVDISAAKRIFEEAQAHESEGRWLDALNLFKRVLAVKETAGIRFHMALCEEHLGQLLAAEADYRRSGELAQKMSGADGQAVLKQSVEALAKLKPRIPQLTVSLPDNVPGLSVQIDGKQASSDQLSRPLSRDPGEVTVRAQAPGRRPFERSLVLLEGTSQTLAVSLDPEAAAPPPPPPSAPSAPPPRLAPEPQAPSRVPLYAAGAFTLVAAGTGVAFYLNHRRLSRENADVCSQPDIETCDPRRADVESRYKTIGLVSGGLAVVGLGATAYFWLSSPPKPAGNDVAWGVGPGWLSVRGRW